MKLRIPLIFLLLVVMPTALLSLMAGLSFRNWEVILQRRLEVSALAAIEGVSARLDAPLERNLEEVLASCTETAAHGGRPSDYAVPAIRLRASHSLIGQVYVFLNPWGFLWPESAVSDGAESGAAERRHRDALTEAMRREIATAGTAAVLRFTSDDASCLFKGIPGRPNLYAGFEVRNDAFAAELSAALTNASQGGILLQAEGPGLGGAASGAEEPGAVIVVDSFAGRTEIPGATAEVQRLFLAQGRLKRPFDFIKVRAFLTDPAELRNREGLRARLYGWGIVLLAGGILAGALFVLRQAAQEIREARKRSEFVMSVSHDLRTPVAAMKMLAESLYFDTVKDPPKRQKFLATIIRECERLNQLVERVLFLVRFGQNALVYAVRTLDPAELVTEAVSLFNARFSESDATPSPVQVNLTLSPDLPPIQGDRTALTQLLLNLLDNAYKYSRKVQHPLVSDQRVEDGGGGITDAGVQSSAIRINVAARKTRKAGLWGEQEYVVMEVRDFGIGIQRNELYRIFRKFYRIAGAGGENVSGVGLGLAMCRHVAAAHGGWIEVESQPGKGSAFALFLPIEDEDTAGRRAS
jgi:signal transduction histidine kinase